MNNLFGITFNSKNTTAAAAVMECMASEGYRKVDQGFYEEGLKKKYNVADQSAQMFDLIRKGMRFDFGSLYGTALGFPFCTIKGYIYSDTATFLGILLQPQSREGTGDPERLLQRSQESRYLKPGIIKQPLWILPMRRRICRKIQV